LGTPELALSLLALAALVLAAAAFLRYGTLLNPLTLHCGVNVLLFTVLSGVSALSAPLALDGRPPDAAFRDAAALTAWIAVAHLLGVAVPYLYHGGAPSWLFGRLAGALGLDRVPRALPFRWSRLLLFLAACAAAYVVLAWAGGGGWLWLTSPRVAYIRYRAGAGGFYMASQWALIMGFAYAIWYRRPRALALLLLVLLFSAPAYFTGSKNNVLSFCALAICYYDFRVQRLRLASFALFGSLLASAVVALLFVQGSSSSLRGVSSYFSEYFGTTTWFLERFDDFGHRWGRGWLSSLWFFVPRGLYPGKPFEYGETLIHRVLFPGMAAQGNTPGVLPWALSYLDFGVAGVFIAGCLQGLWQRATYEYYLANRGSLAAFLLMVQFCIWGIFTLAPAVLLLGFLVAVVLLLRLRVLPPRRAAPQREPA
jgi:oligosaccharide repeat unit polymerase